MYHHGQDSIVRGEHNKAVLHWQHIFLKIPLKQIMKQFLFKLSAKFRKICIWHLFWKLIVGSTHFLKCNQSGIKIKSKFSFWNCIAVCWGEHHLHLIPWMKKRMKNLVPTIMQTTNRLSKWEEYVTWSPLLTMRPVSARGRRVTVLPSTSRLVLTLPSTNSLK